jgi:hypothetical protein
MGDRHCHVAMDLDNGSYRLTRRALELVAVRIGPGAGQGRRCFGRLKSDQIGSKSGSKQKSLGINSGNPPVLRFGL